MWLGLMKNRKNILFAGSQLPGLLIKLRDGLFVSFLVLVLVELTGNWPYDFVNSTSEMTQQKIPAVGGLHGRWFQMAVISTDITDFVSSALRTSQQGQLNHGDRDSIATMKPVEVAVLG
jgi:hypothetical protein